MLLLQVFWKRTLESKTLSTQMSDLPPEIITAILSRLPVKSLLRFRCVSKSWRSLIDAKDFIKLHLRQSSETNSNRTLLLKSTRYFYLDLDSLERLDIDDTRLIGYGIAGVCNGLALIVSHMDEVALLNPATRKMNILPETPLECRKSYDVYFAIGYDSKHDDYKVVRVVQFEATYRETKIYSLNANSWKMIENFPYLLPNDRRWGVCSNDALHTVVKHSDNSESIMAFDLGKEVHYEVLMPPFGSSVGCGKSSVEVMGGYIAAVIPGVDCGEVWLMKEYGVKDSWIKLLCFEPPVPDVFIFLCPLGYSKSGDEVLLNYDGMCLTWYNLRKQIDPLTIASESGLNAMFDASPLEPPFHAEACVESLVSPFSPSRVPTPKQKDGKGKRGKEINKKRDDFLSVGFKLKL